jgi:hypothetical protein
VHVAGAAGHVTPLRHELFASHWTVQLKPGGHVTWLLQFEPATLQSIVHVLALRSHDVQPVGQPFESPCASLGGPGASIEPGTTQKPSEQMRPSLQSDCFVHA